VAGGLRLGGHDRDLLTHQLVHKGAFPHIGVADDVHEARTMRGGIGMCILEFHNIIVSS